MDKNAKYLLKKKLERKVSILTQLRNYDAELFKERLEKEREELKKYVKDLVANSSKLSDDDLSLVSKVYDLIG